MSPKIYLVGRPRFEAQKFLSFLKNEGTIWCRSKKATPAEEIVEVAGRICHFSFGPKQTQITNSEYIKKLIQNAHESVLEHASWTFLITGISRSLTHQLIRHRVGFSFSQLSQEYHDEIDNEPVEPPIIKNHSEIRSVWENAIKTSKDAYRQILNYLEESNTCNDPSKSKQEQKRMARILARSILTNATETKIMVTANARAWRHFFDVRGSVLNSEEMRHLAVVLLEHLTNEAPALFFDFSTELLSDGSSIIVHSK
ncbi:MAG: FAD-dependent thymidylate synthase [Candidatus Hodarchaeota archaeon]